MKEYRITVDGQVFKVGVEEITPSEPGSTGGRARGEQALPGQREEIKPAIQDHRPPLENTFKVEAPMPGAIINVAVKVGDSVKEGAVLLTLEAMKMENEITAPKAGTVQVIHVKAGDTVGSGEVLLEIA